MGLIMGEGGQAAVLTDIAGIEDHLGDMDFKVAGTVNGINALQMDVKVKGLTYDALERALKQAKEGRLFILDKMRATIAEPRDHLSQYAPKMVRIMIPVNKIGVLIGPGGRTIRALQEETGADIDVEDDGSVLIGSSSDAMLRQAKDKIEGLTRDLVVGDIFTGKVVRLTSFGAFVELLPGKDGLIRQVDLKDVEDGLSIGQELTVMVQEIDHLGRINLSQRALYGDGEERAPEPAGRPVRPAQDRPRPPFGPGRQGRPGDSRPGQGSRPDPGRRPPPSSPPGGR
jgi:polyribonucleotide nucleotidyltransferase